MFLAFLFAQAAEATGGGGGGDSSVPQLTIGLGIIAVALVTGQWLFYKYVHTPAIDRAEKALAAEIERATKAQQEDYDRHQKALADERARADRLEAEVKRQNDVLQEKALPSLIAATAVTSESQALLRELRRDQERIRLLEEDRRERGVA